MKREIPFLLTGLIAGLVCAAFPWSGSPWLAILGLTYGIGPLFFVAVVAGILVTGAWRYIRADFLHYLAGLVLCTISYFLGLIVFFAVVGFSSRLFHFRPSEDLHNFGLDVWLGLIAAGAVGASGIALFAALLTGKSSKHLLRRLMLAGLITLVVTFTANLPFQTDWSFLGVLFPLGNALFCYLVGSHILQRGKPETNVTAAKRQPHHRAA
jgi:hypothetical protein